MRLAIHQFEDENRHSLSARAALLDSVNRRNMRMIQRGEQARFALETCEAFGIGDEERRKDFARDVALQPQIAGAVNLTHAAGTERPDDLVTTYPGARG